MRKEIKNAHKELLQKILEDESTNWSYYDYGSGPDSIKGYQHNKNANLTYKIITGTPFIYGINIDINNEPINFSIFRYSFLGKLIRKMIINRNIKVGEELLKKTENFFNN